MLSLAPGVRVPQVEDHWLNQCVGADKTRFVSTARLLYYLLCASCVEGHATLHQGVAVHGFQLQQNAYGIV
jgi:hypothetical protein